MISDGILEAQNLSGEFFGFERLLNAAKRQPITVDSNAILDGIWDEVEAFVNEAEAQDDMTMVVIQTWEGVC